MKFVYSRTEVCGITTERDFQRRQELIHTRQKILRTAQAKDKLRLPDAKFWRDLRSGSRCDGGLAFEHDNAVSEVRGHDEVVLNYESCLFSVQYKSTASLVMTGKSRTDAYRLMTLLAMIRCSESKKLVTCQPDFLSLNCHRFSPARFVNQIYGHVGLAQCQDDGDALQFSS